MRAEYKRDMNRNYLVLEEECEINTASYQVRMLVGNSVPSLLKCHLQGMDGKVLFCYDITSRQAVSALFVKQKLGVEELQLLFGSFVKAVEEIAEYLLNPGHLVLDPDYIFLDVEKREAKFCYLPGYDHGIREQFQALTEYVLPLLDHQDEKAVILGYGIYRRAMEDQFHLECVKEELYGAMGNSSGEKEPVGAESKRKQTEEEKAPVPESRAAVSDQTDFGSLFSEEDNRSFDEKTRGEQRNSGMGKLILGCAGFALVMLGIMAACVMGYLPWIEIEWILGATVAGMAAGCVIYFLLRQKKKKRAEKEEEPWREKVRRNLEQETNHREEEWASLQRMEEERYKPCKRDMGVLSVRRDTHEKESFSEPPQAGAQQEDFGETVVLCERKEKGPASLVSREPGELATIYLDQELTVVGKLAVAADAVLPLPTVSRVHARIRRRDGEYYLTDLNSRNGTSVNGIMLKGDEEYRLQDEDQVDFAQARFVFLK